LQLPLATIDSLKTRINCGSLLVSPGGGTIHLQAR
jgi:hypothetical protein